MSEPTIPQRVPAFQTQQRYVVIAARAYSGSTLLAGLLGAHPDITTVGEVSGRRREPRMDTFLCSCGTLMVDCPFWHAVQAGMHGRGYDDFGLGNFRLNFSPPRTGWLDRVRSGSLRWSFLEDARDRLFGMWPGHTATLHELGRRNRAFAETILGLNSARVFVDASKERMRVRYLQRYLGMDVKVIHLVRDVRGVVDSAARHAGHSIDVAAAAQAWASTNRTLARHIESLSPESRRIVRYEDLCAAPEATLSALYEFCGVDPLAAARPRVGGAQHVIGNRRRLAAGWSEIRPDERWRSSLTAEDLSRIASAAGDVAARFYPEVELRVAVSGHGPTEAQQ